MAPPFCHWASANLIVPIVRSFNLCLMATVTIVTEVSFVHSCGNEWFEAYNPAFSHNNPR